MSILLFRRICLIVTSVFICLGCMKESPLARDNLELVLSLQTFSIEEEKIILQLTITNKGKERLVIPYLQNGLLEQYMVWNGWRLSIRNQHIINQQWQTFDFTSNMSPLLRAKHLIVLKPGEGFTVTTNIAHTKWFYSEETQKPELIDISGEYQASMILSLRKENVPITMRHAVSMGLSESNTIRFVIPPP